jgi:hypothetical protein
MNEKNKDIEMINEPLTTEEGFLNPACINELSEAINNMPKTHDRLANNPEWIEKRWTFLSEISGYLAMWAVRQSPHGCPDDLERVIKYLNACLVMHFKAENMQEAMVEISLCEINKLLYSILYEQGVTSFDNWNKPRVGKAPDISFCSRYDKPDPDHDFIDLDALLHNVCVSIRDERRKSDAFYKEFEKEHVKLT